MYNYHGLVCPALCGIAELAQQTGYSQEDTQKLVRKAIDAMIALVEEGDIIKINIPECTLNLDVSDEELAKRRSKWQPREPKITTGYLARYASLVTSGNRGAILEVPGKEK